MKSNSVARAWGRLGWPSNHFPANLAGMRAKTVARRLRLPVECLWNPDSAQAVRFRRGPPLETVTRAERRLVAVLAADVAGYSRLMGADEEGTHARLRAHLRELIDPKIAAHHGRVVKNTGDGFLAEFASVIDAVRCAVEVQR